MKKILSFILLFSVLQVHAQNRLSSPNGKNLLTFELNNVGTPIYQLTFAGRVVLRPSSMGLKIKEGDLKDNFEIKKIDTSSFNQVWSPIWGEEKSIVNNYREMRVTLEQKDANKRQLVITFRLFNDGLGFRYEFPEQKEVQHFTVLNECTQFNFTGNHRIWWLPGDYDTNEYPQRESDLNDVLTYPQSPNDEIFAKTPITVPSTQTPLMMRSKDGLYINIHEAALRNYPAMNLEYKGNFEMQSTLVPDALGNMAYLYTPSTTPWRTIVVGEKSTDILASRLILNLNEPAKAGADASWIKPMKYVGIWWEMHVGKKTWDKAGSQVASQNGEISSQVTRHGATTEHTKKHIDFAAKHGFGGVLVEGWNTGWEDWFGKWKEDVFDFTTPYSDFNLKEVNDYARSKGVTIITHLETSGSVTNFERYADTAFRQMMKYGSQACKTGYVGKIIPRGEHHDGQWMVKHYERMAAKTLDYKRMLVAHEPVRPTGLHRTYPNWMACEAARGNEFNAWSSGNPPEHETILPFTRLMGGPMDYTPGIFTIKMSSYWPDSKNQVHTTLAKQLALYITLYSPVQMAADIIDNYEKKMDAFQFIKDVPVDWERTEYLSAEPGDYVVIARKDKASANWFLGAITDDQARNLPVNCSFLTPGKRYRAVIYADGKDASWDKNPESYLITSQDVTSKSLLQLNLASGGGCAISFFEVK